MLHSTLFVAEMLTTRLCHDLTGPIGAVNNGVEFLEEENFSMNTDALKLITDSGREAVARLLFFRQAYGGAKDAGDACLEDRKKLVQGYLRQTRVGLDWPDTHTDAADVSISQGTAKLLLNLVVLVTGALIRGGTLHIRLEKLQGGKRIQVYGDGETVKLDEAVLAALTEDVSPETLTPKTVQAYVTRQLSLRLEAPLTLTHDAQSIHFTLEKRIP